MEKYPKIQNVTWGTQQQLQDYMHKVDFDKRMKKKEEFEK